MRGFASLHMSEAFSVQCEGNILRPVTFERSFIYRCLENKQSQILEMIVVLSNRGTVLSLNLLSRVKQKLGSQLQLATYRAIHNWISRSDMPKVQRLHRSEPRI